MFISVLALFKIGIGPSSSHTLGPMVAANDFITHIIDQKLTSPSKKESYIRCTLKGSLAFTGKGHSTDNAVALGLHGYLPASLADKDIASVVKRTQESDHICIHKNLRILFNPNDHIIFDKGDPLPEHPNGMIFELINSDNKTLYSETYFSIGGGFINTLAEISQLQAPLKMESTALCKYPFDSAKAMLQMASDSHISIAQMKRMNELEQYTESTLIDGMDKIWKAMQTCLEKGLKTEGILPGGLGISRRAKGLYQSLKNNPD
ncbi:MAG: L-serine ammonia-lyase, partial [Colwellia sp.]|nr:L-serine ammonia-lyase [Colwellia sp.]